MQAANPALSALQLAPLMLAGSNHPVLAATFTFFKLSLQILVALIPKKHTSPPGDDWKQSLPCSGSDIFAGVQLQQGEGPGHTPCTGCFRGISNILSSTNAQTSLTTSIGKYKLSELHFEVTPDSVRQVYNMTRHTTKSSGI